MKSFFSLQFFISFSLFPANSVPFLLNHFLHRCAFVKLFCYFTSRRKCSSPQTTTKSLFIAYYFSVSDTNLLADLVGSELQFFCFYYFAQSHFVLASVVSMFSLFTLCPIYAICAISSLELQKYKHCKKTCKTFCKTLQNNALFLQDVLQELFLSRLVLFISIYVFGFSV